MKALTSIVLINFFFFIFLGECFFNQHPVDIIVQRIEDCNSTKYIKFDLNVRKVGRKRVQVWDGNITLPIPVDDKLQGKISYAKWGDGGWKYNVLNLQRNDPCGVLTLFYGQMFTNMQRSIGVKEGCPVSKGNYTFTNMSVDWKAMKMKLWFTGMAKVGFPFLKDQEVLVCKLFTVEIFPIAGKS